MLQSMMKRNFTEGTIDNVETRLGDPRHKEHKQGKSCKKEKPEAPRAEGDTGNA